MISDYTVFRVQAGFSFSILVFCMGMLIANKDESYYLPILTSIIGYWLPSPQYRGTNTAPPLLPAAVRELPMLFMKRAQSRRPDDDATQDAPADTRDAEADEDEDAGEDEAEEEVDIEMGGGGSAFAGPDAGHVTRASTATRPPREKIRGT